LSLIDDIIEEHLVSVGLFRQDFLFLVLLRLGLLFFLFLDVHLFDGIFFLAFLLVIFLLVVFVCLAIFAFFFIFVVISCCC